jgi:hypothetical protein
MSISQMEKVDMGAAQPSMHNTLDTNTLLPLIKGSSCEGKGFYRPYYLHLSPNGGLRNCMYAPNGGWLGNIQTSSLTSILNSISDNPVYRTFVDDGALEVFIDAYITPWQDGYRNIENGCTASAMVARVIEVVHQISQDSQTPSAQQMAEIHDSVRRQYRLG